MRIRNKTERKVKIRFFDEMIDDRVEVLNPGELSGYWLHLEDDDEIIIEDVKEVCSEQE